MVQWLRLCLAMQGVQAQSLLALVVKNLPANGGDVRDVGSIPRLGRSPGGKAWQPGPIFLPGKSLDGGAWQAKVHGVTKSYTRLGRLSTDI